jgi:peptide/nickel transport system substrate-binding protein
MKMQTIKRKHSSAHSRPRIAASIAGLASLTLVLAACGTASTPEGSSNSDGSSSSEIRNAGVIVHAQNGEPASLDPARTG